MKSLFAKIIIPAMLLIILGFSSLSLYAYNMREIETEALIETTGTQALRQFAQSIEMTDAALNAMQEALNFNYLRMTKLLRALIEIDPAVVSTERMMKLAQDFGVDELHVIDANGIIAQGTQPAFFGFNCKDSPQTAALLPALRDPSFEMAQAPQIRGVDKTYFQYISVARRDQPGIIQIGLAPREREALFKASGWDSQVAATQVGKDGFAFLLDSKGIILAHSQIEKKGSSLEKELFDHILKGDGHITLQKNGKAIAYYFKKSAQQYLVVGLPLKTYTDALQKFQYSLMAANGLCILVSGVLLFLLIHFIIIRPLKEGGRFAQEVSQGEYAAHWENQNQDEIGQLATSLNQAFARVVDKIFWYEALLDAIPEPISVTDQEMRLTFLNKSSTELLGKSREALIGKKCSEWKTQICNTEKCGISCLQNGRPNPQLTIKTPDGTERQMLAKPSIVHDLHGKKAGYIEVFSDITELLRAQHAAEMALSEGMHKAAYALEHIVDSLSQASEQISCQVLQSGKGADEQAQRVTAAVETMEVMNGQGMQIAQSAAQTAQSSDQTQQYAREGSTVVHDVLAAITLVYEKAEEMQQSLTQLGERAQGIGSILEVISNIADQTNLLALNAAIEAARAGDAGRGFAVVADEVRKLAEKTMLATQDVASAVTGIQSGTQDNIAFMTGAKTAVAHCAELAHKSSDSLERIVEISAISSSQAQEIAQESAQQSENSAAIAHRMEQINSIAENTRHAMSEAEHAVAGLVRQAQELSGLIENMKKQ